MYCVDREFAERTVELWNMDDREYLNELTIKDIRAIVSLDLKETYGIRTRSPCTHHLTRPGHWGEGSVN